MNFALVPSIGPFQSGDAAVMKVERLLFPGLDLEVWQLTVVDGDSIVDAAGCGPPGHERPPNLYAIFHQESQVKRPMTRDIECPMPPNFDHCPVSVDLVLVSDDLVPRARSNETAWSPAGRTQRIRSCGTRSTEIRLGRMSHPIWSPQAAAAATDQID
ncbi:hypothetical protein [Streptomyces spiramyceticus]|uniref:hypothetical protein n=1 Tax=Streptomyces spiramyceticus TaxID=299717 RepID=UPI00237B47A4|nr:hypothetical protein [Streptomyces spiramyceticus]